MQRGQKETSTGIVIRDRVNSKGFRMYLHGGFICQ